MHDYADRRSPQWTAGSAHICWQSCPGDQAGAFQIAIAQLGYSQRGEKAGFIELCCSQAALRLVALGFRNRLLLGCDTPRAFRSNILPPSGEGRRQKDKRGGERGLE